MHRNRKYSAIPAKEPYDFSKTVLANVKGNGKKTQGVGKNPFSGLPYARNGVLPSQSVPMAHPFWEWHPWLDRVVSLANSGAWGVAIVGKLKFPHHAAPLGFLRALPAIKSCPGGCPSVGIHFFLPIMQLPRSPRHPSPSIIFGRMPIHGKCFPPLFPLPGTHPGHLQPLPYVSPVCMHLVIANIFYL